MRESDALIKTMGLVGKAILASSYEHFMTAINMRLDLNRYYDDILLPRYKGYDKIKMLIPHDSLTDVTFMYLALAWKTNPNPQVLTEVFKRSKYCNDPRVIGDNRLLHDVARHGNESLFHEVIKHFKIDQSTIDWPRLFYDAIDGGNVDIFDFMVEHCPLQNAQAPFWIQLPSDENKRIEHFVEKSFKAQNRLAVRWLLEKAGESVKEILPSIIGIAVLYDVEFVEEFVVWLARNWEDQKGTLLNFLVRRKAYLEAEELIKAFPETIQQVNSPQQYTSPLLVSCKSNNPSEIVTGVKKLWDLMKQNYQQDGDEIFRLERTPTEIEYRQNTVYAAIDNGNLEFADKLVEEYKAAFPCDLCFILLRAVMNKNKDTIRWIVNKSQALLQDPRIYFTAIAKSDLKTINFLETLGMETHAIDQQSLFMLIEDALCKANFECADYLCKLGTFEPNDYENLLIEIGARREKFKNPVKAAEWLIHKNVDPCPAREDKRTLLGFVLTRRPKHAYSLVKLLKRDDLEKDRETLQRYGIGALNSELLALVETTEDGHDLVKNESSNDMIDWLIEHIQDLNAVSEEPVGPFGLMSEPFTPLEAACMAGNSRLVKKLIAKGADPKVAANPQEQSVCNYACSHGPEFVELLRMHGADIEGAAAVPPLFLAISYNKPELVKYLLVKGSNPNGLLDVDVEKITLLMLACEKYQEITNNDPDDDDECESLADSAKIIKLLLKFGADPNVTSDRGGNTLLPLLTAIETGNRELVSLLLSHGANPDNITLHSNRNLELINPLHVALISYLNSSRKSSKTYTDIISALLSYGANPFRSITDTEGKQTSFLATAQAKGKTELINLLKVKQRNKRLPDTSAIEAAAQYANRLRLHAAEHSPTPPRPAPPPQDKQISETHLLLSRELQTCIADLQKINGTLQSLLSIQRSELQLQGVTGLSAKETERLNLKILRRLAKVVLENNRDLEQAVVKKVSYMGPLSQERGEAVVAARLKRQEAFKLLNKLDQDDSHGYRPQPAGVTPNWNAVSEKLPSKQEDMVSKVGTRKVKNPIRSADAVNGFVLLVGQLMQQLKLKKSDQAEIVETLNNKLLKPLSKCITSPYSPRMKILVDAWKLDPQSKVDPKGKIDPEGKADSSLAPTFVLKTLLDYLHNQHCFGERIHEALVDTICISLLPKLEDQKMLYYPYSATSATEVTSTLPGNTSTLFAPVNKRVQTIPRSLPSVMRWTSTS